MCLSSGLPVTTRLSDPVKVAGAVAAAAFTLVRLAVLLHEHRVIDLSREGVIHRIDIHRVAVRRQLDPMRQPLRKVRNELPRDGTVARADGERWHELDLDALLAAQSVHTDIMLERQADVQDYNKIPMFRYPSFVILSPGGRASNVWEFYDYVGADGTNEVHAWVWGLSAKARAKINTRVSTLEQLPRAQWINYVGPLTGDHWNGIFEIRARLGDVQYRPLFCFGPANEAATILMGAREVGNRIEPRSAPGTCQTRKTEVMGGGHAERHRYD